MVREIDYTSPLSEEDVAYLLERRPKEYVDRLVEQAGGIQGGDSSADASSDGENGSSTGSQPDGDPNGQSDGDGPGDGNGDGDSSGDGQGDPQGDGDGGSDEDLIGDEGLTDYDPGDHTADEVVTYFKSGVTDAEKARVIALEKDGKGRTTILNA